VARPLGALVQEHNALVILLVSRLAGICLEAKEKGEPNIRLPNALW
jgi:hypothetical protein